MRAAREGERLTTLDGEERVFDGDAVLVCDADGPDRASAGSWAAPAARSSADTTRVAMEAATWNGTNILQTSKKLGLRTEASTRFEKQLHPAPRAAGAAPRGPADGRAVRRADGAGHGRRGGARARAAPRRAAQRAARRACSASAIEPEESQAILERLGFGVERRDGDLEVEVPYWRHYDVYREADLIEEVARVHGLQRLPATLPARRAAVGGAVARRRSCAATIEDLLRGRGLSEVVTSASSRPTRCAGCGSPDDDLRGAGAAGRATRSARTSR